MAQKLNMAFLVVLFLVGCSGQLDIPSEGSAGESNGREFIFAVPSYFTNPRKMIANLTIIGMSRDASNVTIQIIGLNHTEDLHVRYHQAATVGLPYKTVAGLKSDYVNSVRVVATNDVSVRCIVGYRIGNHPGDGFLVLPTLALDTEYIIATVPPPKTTYSQHNAQFTVSAVFDNTSIDIVSMVALTVFKQTFIPREVVRFSLDRHESVVIRAEDDLTGTRVTATKAVAVVSGNDCGTTPRVRTKAECYYLVEQLMPTSTWGTEFSVYPFQSNDMTHVIRLILKKYENYKLVIEDDVLIHVTVRAETNSFDYMLSGHHLVKISANRPVTIVHYVHYISSVKKSVYSSGGMMVVPPQEQLNRRVSVVMPLPKEMVQERSLIIPYMSVCIIINCSYVDAVLVNGKAIKINVRVRVFRPPDLHACAIETYVSADFGDVITFSTSSSSVRMQVAVQGYYGGYLNFLYTASQRYEKHAKDFAQSIGDDEDLTTHATIYTPSRAAEETFTTHVAQGIKFSSAHYAYIAGGGVLCLLAVTCLICFIWKCLRQRSSKSIDQPIKETSSPTRRASHTDYEDINIDMCTFVRTPSAMTNTSGQEMGIRPSLPKKLRGTPATPRQPTDSQFNLDNLKSKDGQDHRSVVSPKSFKLDCSDDYGYMNQSLPEGDYHDYMPMKSVKSKKCL